MGLALKGFGVWSLVGQSMLNSLLRALLTWQASGWRPSLRFSKESLASMFPFGSRMLMWGLLDAVFQNLYQPVIGKRFTAADVGFFTRSQTLHTAILQPTALALARVMFPALSEIQEDAPRLKNTVKEAIVNIALLQFPLAIGLLVVADPLITALMTERWAQSIPYLQLFCIAALLYPLEVINSSVLMALGKMKLVFRLEIVKKSAIILAIFITFRWGIAALLIGQIVTSTLAYLLYSQYAGRCIAYSTLQQLRDVLPSLLVAIMMGIGVHFMGAMVDSLMLRLIVQVTSGGLVYLALNYAFNRPALVRALLLAKQAVQ